MAVNVVCERPLSCQLSAHKGLDLSHNYWHSYEISHSSSFFPRGIIIFHRTSPNGKYFKLYRNFHIIVVADSKYFFLDFSGVFWWQLNCSNLFPESSLLRKNQCICSIRSKCRKIFPSLRKNYFSTRRTCTC